MYGRFNVCTHEGQSVMPVGAKTCALIALLASSEDFSRSRAWLQDMLWSDRGRPQRAASLRQALAELRRTWAQWPGLIDGDRTRIALDPERVQVVAPEGEGAFTFLEDLAVRDPAFTAWLGLQRLHRNKIATPLHAPVTATGIAAAPSPTRDVVILCESDQDPEASIIENAFQDMLSQSLKEMVDVVLRSPRLQKFGPNSFLVCVRVLKPGGSSGTLRVAIEDSRDGTVVWNGRTDLPPQPADPTQDLALHAMCSKAVEAVSNALTQVRRPEDSTDQQALSSLLSAAVRNIFSIQADLVAKAVSQLRDALALREHGLIHAWLAQAYTIQYVERYVAPDADLRDRTEEACRKALSLASSNSNVLAAVANARTNIDRNYEAGLRLSELSIKANPANPLAWWAYSNAQQCTGRSLPAFQAAQTAQKLADGTRFQFWADFQVSLTAAVLGRQDMAISTGELSSALSPDFRPPLRYLTALYALDGRHDAMSRTVERLQRCEPDFSLYRMMEDGEYPIGIMRRYGTRLTRALRSASDTF